MADLKPGSSTISKIYAGSSEVQKVYAGSTLVYQVSAGTDWDTYENGIFFVNTFTDRDGAVSTPAQKRWQGVRWDGPLKEPAGTTHTYYNLSQSIYRQGPRNLYTTTDGRLNGWGDDSGRPVVGSANSGTVSGVDIPPYIAVYDVTRGEWQGVANGTGSGSDRLFYSTPVMFDPSASYANTHESVNNRVIIVSYEQDPGDISGWRDYDGPDDWDTWEDGLFVVRNWASVDTSLADMTVVKASSSYSTPTDNFYNSPARGRYYAANQYPQWIAVWSITSGAWVAAATVSTTFGTTDPNIVVRWGGVGDYTMTAGDDYVVIYLTREPQNFVNWRDYDGPLYSGWDDPNFSYTGHAASSGAEYLNPPSIVWDWTDGYLDGATHIARVTTYGLRNYGGTNPHSVGALWRVFYDSLHGWIYNGPSTQTYDIPDINTYPFGLNYSTYNTNTPAALFLTTTDPQDISNWPAYDGPVANWDTYANGVKFFTTISTSTQNPVNVPSYPATTYSSAPSTILLTSSNSPVTNGLYIEHSVYDPTQTLSDSNMPPYIAMYYNEAQATGGFADMPPGWYVFQNYDQTFRPRGRTTWEKPIAWPTPSGNYNYYSNVIDTGYVSSSNTNGPFAVFLDEYSDPLGSGGTDHWTPPPYISYANPSKVLTNGIATTQSSGFDIQTDPGTYCTEYGFGDIRNSGTCRVRAAQTLGTREIDVYNGTTLYATGVGTFTGTTLTTASLTVQSGFTGNVFTDFNPVGTDADPAMIIVYTHVDRP